MTFEAWWAKNRDEFMHLAQAAPELGDDLVRRYQAACWNAAIAAVEEHAGTIRSDQAVFFGHRTIAPDQLSKLRA